MTHGIAILTTGASQRDSVLDAVRDNVSNVLTEQGCIEYEATVDASPFLKFHTHLGPDTFVVIEKWDSLESLAAHSVHFCPVIAPKCPCVADGIGSFPVSFERTFFAPIVELHERDNPVKYTWRVGLKHVNS